MNISIQTFAQSYEEALGVARWADENGIHTFAAADHYLSGADDSVPTLDQLTVLAGVAQATNRIRLATLVSPITFRHPAVYAKTFTTLDDISGGRFALGLGTGWMEKEHEQFGLEFPPLAERFDRLDEALSYFHAATTASSKGFNGNFYSLSKSEVRPVPRSYDLIIGGSGPNKTPDLAGRFATEFNASVSDKHPIDKRIERARDAAVDAGRDPDALAITTAFPPLFGEDGADVKRRIEGRAQLAGIEPDELVKRYRELGVPLGTPDQVADAMTPLLDSGVEGVYLQCFRMSLDVIKESVAIMRKTMR